MGKSLNMLNEQDKEKFNRILTNLSNCLNESDKNIRLEVFNESKLKIMAIIHDA